MNSITIRFKFFADLSRWVGSSIDEGFELFIWSNDSCDGVIISFLLDGDVYNLRHDDKIIDDGLSYIRQNYDCYDGLMFGSASSRRGGKLWVL